MAFKNDSKPPEGAAGNPIHAVQNLLMWVPGRGELTRPPQCLSPLRCWETFVWASCSTVMTADGLAFASVAAMTGPNTNGTRDVMRPRRSANVTAQ